MIGSVEVRCCAAQPQKPLAPVFSFKDSPQSFRILDVPKSIGTWELTRVYVGLNYPDNTNVEKNATRQGNVWVATVEGCPIAGKTMGGFTIYADGTDEGGNAVEGYVLGNGDVYVMEKSEKISALVGKTTMRYLDDIPAAPAKGDVLVVGEELKIYNGEEWVTISGGSSADTYTKEEIDEMVDEIDSSIGELASSVSTLDSSVSELGASVSALDSSVSALDSSVSVLSASVSSFGEDLATVTASVSSLTSSMTSLASTKRDFDDRTWVFNAKTDPLMFGIQSFHIQGDISEEDLTSFDADTRRWYENDEEGDWFIQAIVDELGQPHFNTYNQSTGEWIGSFSLTEPQPWQVGNLEITAVPRSNTDLLVIDDLKGKRDVNDRVWTYPMDDDEERFGIGHFNVLSDQGDQYLTILDKSGSTLTWKQDLIQEYKLEISTTNGKNFTFTNLTDQSNPISTTFEREGDGNVNWDVVLGGKSFYVKLIRRDAGKFAVYDVKNGDTTKQYLNFNNPTNAPITICADSENRDQSFIDINGARITNGNYQTGRGVKARAVDPHIKVNGEAVAFVNEVEAATSQLTSEIGTVTASVSALGSSVSGLTSSVSAMASTVESVSANVSALGSSVSALGSSVSTLGSSIETMGSSISAMASTVEANTSSISTIVSSLSSYATTSYVDDKAKTVWRTWEYEPDGLKFTAEQANSTVAMQAVGSAPSVSLEYSTDKGKTWNDFVVGTTTVTLPNVGDKMIMRAKTTNTGMGSSNSDYNKFVMTGKIAASGSIMYLLKNDGDLSDISQKRCFVSLFYGCISLTSAPELPATTLAEYSYREMFYGCSSLKEIKIGYTGNFAVTIFHNWVSGVASTGTFYYNGSDTTTGGGAIPTGWTVQTF